ATSRRARESRFSPRPCAAGATPTFGPQQRKRADMTVVRTNRLAVCVAALLAVVAGADIAAAQSREVRIGHNPALANPSGILGITKGHFAQAGVTVTERVFNNPADIVQAIATGDLDAGVSSSGVLLTAMEKGVKVKAVALTQGGQVPPVTYMVRADSGIK